MGNTKSKKEKSKKEEINNKHTVNDNGMIGYKTKKLISIGVYVIIVAFVGFIPLIFKNKLDLHNDGFFTLSNLHSAFLTALITFFFYLHIKTKFKKPYKTITYNYGNASKDLELFEATNNNINKIIKKLYEGKNILIRGDNGVGKSTLLNGVTDKLKLNKNYVPIVIKLWEYEGEGSVWEVLIAKMINSGCLNKFYKKKLAKTNWANILFKNSSDVPYYDDMVIEELKCLFHGGLKKGKKYVEPFEKTPVFIIDEIDRVFDHRMFEVLNLIYILFTNKYVSWNNKPKQIVSANKWALIHKVLGSLHIEKDSVFNEISFREEMFVQEYLIKYFDEFVDIENNYKEIITRYLKKGLEKVKENSNEFINMNYLLEDIEKNNGIGNGISSLYEELNISVRYLNKMLFDESGDAKFTGIFKDELKTYAKFEYLHILLLNQIVSDISDMDNAAKSLIKQFEAIQSEKEFTILQDVNKFKKTLKYEFGVQITQPFKGNYIKVVNMNKDKFIQFNSFFAKTVLCLSNNANNFNIALSIYNDLVDKLSEKHNKDKMQIRTGTMALINEDLIKNKK